MNHTLTIADPLPETRAKTRPDLYQRLVFAAFAKMNAGSLRLELPDGSCAQFGTPDADVSATISVLDVAFFRRCVLFGDVGFGESYVDGEWETDSIERVISWAIQNVENSPLMSGSKVRNIGLNLLRFSNRVQHLLRPNDERTARRNIAAHYDLGNDFYRLWLDPTMTYSSAYFTDAGESLEAAQTAKYDALCRKLQLRASDHVLEIGSGWAASPATR